MAEETKFGALKCSQCLRRFVPPFEKCLSEHFVCNGCQHHRHDAAGTCSSVVLQREDIDKNFNNLKAFCQYGCGRRQNLKELIWHEHSCIKRNNPAKCLIDSCSWRGFTPGLISHVDSAHPNNIVVNCKQSDRILDISRTTPVTLVLLYDKTYYCNALYWVILLAEGNRRYLTVLYQGKIDVIVNPEIDYYTLLNQSDENAADRYAHSYDQAGFKDYDITNVKGDKFQILLKTCGAQFLPKYWATRLECPACNILLCSPIHVCSNGHSICGSCKDNISGQCPTCGKEILEIRNFAMEKLVENFMKDCTNNGCLENIISYSYSQHQKVCHFRNMNCATDCNWTGPFAEFYEHCIIAHDWYKGNGESCKIKKKLYSDEEWGLKIMPAFGKIFALKYHYFPVYVAFKVVDITTEANSDFSYEIRFRNRTSGYTIGYTGDCITNKSIKNIEKLGDDYKTITDEDGLQSIYDENNEFECVLHVFTPRTGVFD